MTRPRPFDVGDQRHLTWGSIRWSVARHMRLGAEMAGDPLGQYAAILGGADVELTQEQVVSFVPVDRWPPRLDHFRVWVLSGDDTLVPLTKKRRARGIGTTQEES